VDWSQLLHAVLVGAPVASGVVTATDTGEATAVPRVHRVLVAGDLPRPAKGFAEQSVPPLATHHLPLQGERVLYHGQQVAMVLADTLEAAEEAASRVRVEIEEEPWQHPEQADAQTPEPAGYAALSSLDVSVGDIDAAVSDAAVTVAARYTQSSRHNNPMEPSAILAHWSGDQLTVYDSVQHLYAVQSTLAAAFGIAPSSVRVVCPHTGGGFGAKAFVWPHEILAAMAARIVDRPVKLVLTRAQMYANVGYQPWMSQDVTLAARPNGALTGIRHDVVNVTALTDDYVEFGSVTAGALYASPAIATSQRVSPTLPAGLSKRSYRATVACAAARSGSGSLNSSPGQAAPSLSRAPSTWLGAPTSTPAPQRSRRERSGLSSSRSASTRRSAWYGCVARPVFTVPGRSSTSAPRARR
jgi:xanthine dehydrogenase YagR molybdenum-binding subunit